MHTPKRKLYRSSAKASGRRPFHASVSGGCASEMKSREFYKDMIDEIAEGIVSHDLEGNILFVNKAAAKMLDLPKTQIVGRHFSDFIDKPSLQRAQDFFKQVRGGKTILQQIINIRGRDRRVFPIEFSASPNIENGRVVQVHAIFRNVAERKEMEALVLESEKMNAIQHFITGTAQEIRNPLKGLSDRLEKLLYEYERRDFEYIGYKEYRNLFELIRHMRDQAKYCFETTERLLDISKRKIGRDELSCHINEVIKDVLEKMRPQIEAGHIRLQCRLARHLPCARIGAIELAQVITHILKNAVQSVTHAGMIVVRTKYLPREKRILIECRDNGVGISKEHLTRIFEPFYTTKARGQEVGSGLGLSIVYSIVKNHKGDIRVQSNLREGTRVLISFPAAGKKNHFRSP